MYLVQTYTDFTLKFETHSNYGETYESGEKIGDKFEGKRWKSCDKRDIAGSSPDPQPFDLANARSFYFSGDFHPRAFPE